MRFPRTPFLAASLAIAVVACSAGTESTDSTLVPAGSVPGSGPLTNSTTTTDADPSFSGAPGLVVIPPGGVDLYAEPGGSPFYRPAGGLTFPILAEDGEWLQVLTTCNTERWLQRDEVDVVTTAVPAEPGPGFDLSRAIIVIDPGHGGRDLGAKGATGANESDANLAVANHLRERLEAGQTIDWDTGRVSPGDEYPPIHAVWMTRDPDGPEVGDYELGLAYRAGVSNGTGADALVSIHNNTSPALIKESPGTDVFYSVGSDGSDRLASLIHEEMIDGLQPFGDVWGSGTFSGPRARFDRETGEDFYGLLRRTMAPSVIIEGMYISTEAEERLLQSELVQMAYADAVYRGLIRFLTTDEWGSEVREPDPFDGPVGSPSTSSCVVPAQP